MEGEEGVGEGPGVPAGLENRRGSRRETSAEDVGEQHRINTHGFCVNFARDFSGEMLSLEIQLGVREPIEI